MVFLGGLFFSVAKLRNPQEVAILEGKYQGVGFYNRYPNSNTVCYELKLYSTNKVCRQYYGSFGSGIVRGKVRDYGFKFF